MNVQKNSLILAFERVGVSFQRGSYGLVGISEDGNGGVRIESPVNVSAITAVKLLFPAKSAEAFRILVAAFWEGVLPNHHWKQNVDECVECALNGTPYTEIINDIEINLRHYETEAELVARCVPSG